MQRLRVTKNLVPSKASKHKPRQFCVQNKLLFVYAIISPSFYFCTLICSLINTVQARQGSFMARSRRTSERVWTFQTVSKNCIHRHEMRCTNSNWYNHPIENEVSQLEFGFPPPCLWIDWTQWLFLIPLLDSDLDICTPPALAIFFNANAAYCHAIVIYIWWTHCMSTHLRQKDPPLWFFLRFLLFPVRG